MSVPREFPNAVEAWKYLKKRTATVRAQERRQKILDDIHRITSGKASDVPVSQDLLQDRFEALEVNGILKHVLKHLTNASDITSAYFASDMFKNHLEQKRMMMHLPQVFAVLREKEYLNYDEDPFDEQDNEEGNRDVLNQRLVSKEWKKAADEQFLEPTGFSRPDWYLRRDEESYYDGTMSGPITCTFRSIENVDLALNALCTCDRDLRSLLPRIIYVNDRAIGNHEIFYSKIKEFLDIHGESVWKLCFMQNPQRNNYKDLWNCVSRMPNLKEVSLYCGGLDLPGDEETRLLREYPFPTLPALKRLSIQYVSTAELLTAEILKRNPGLRTVCLKWANAPGLLNVLLPVLTNLDLESFAFSRVVSGTPEDIQPLRRLEWPLKVLNLSIESTMDASEVFGILNQFNDSLEEINLGSMKLKDNDQAVIVSFPNLRNIEKVSIKF